MPGNMVQGQGKGFAIVPHRIQVREGLGCLGELLFCFCLVFVFVFDTESIVVLMSQWISLAKLIMMSFSFTLYYFQSSFTFINVLIWYSSSLSES